MKVLVNNLFDGVLQRGIVNYTRNLTVCLLHMGYDVKTINSDGIHFTMKLPRQLFNILFVFYEQFVIPVVGIFYKKVIYPYNSASLILSVFSSKQLIIIHDFIPYNKGFSLSQAYLRCTTYIHSLCKRDVAFITPKIEKEAIDRSLFINSKRYIIPNSFFELESIMKAGRDKAEPGNYILLCSGLSENKDLKGALDLLQYISLDERVVVFGAPKYKIDNSIYSSVEILGQLSINEVATWYRNAKFVWVHSKSEGFGRSIVEARMAGKRVLASAIPEFLDQADDNVFFYLDTAEFVKGWNMAAKPAKDVGYKCEYNELTKRALESWCADSRLN